MKIIGLIPGVLREIRYTRTGANPGPYFHTFKPGARMYALGDGSIRFKGPRRLWADEREPGFWGKYGHHRRGRNPMKKRRREGGGGIPIWVWLLGGFLLFSRGGISAASLGLGQQTNNWWASKATGALTYAPGLLPPDGLGPVESAFRPASDWEILTGGST